jgi:pimeloyl-ACP methyl ester carboxylesterase
MRGEFVDLHGVRLYCYAFGQRGSGQPIVLVHGGFTSSSLWQDLLPRLPKGHRVLVLDLLGHGRSDPAGTARMTAAAHAERVRQLLDVMGMRELLLVGHGLGTAVAARVAHAERTRVTRLMLVNPAMLSAGSRGRISNGRLRRVAALVPLWQRLDPAWLASALHHALLPCFAHRDVGARALDVYLKPFRRPEGRDSACAQLRALRESDADAAEVLQAGGLPCPTSLVLGSDDPYLDSARAEALTDTLRRATDDRLSVHQLPGVRHMAPGEAPDRLGTLVGELLAR